MGACTTPTRDFCGQLANHGSFSTVMTEDAQLVVWSKSSGTSPIG
jgi:hypothetical protein